MRILFDHGTPDGLVRALLTHSVTFAREKQWERLSNGALLTAGEQAGFELMLTTDSKIRYQQNLVGRRIALVVVTGSTDWARIKLCLAEISAAVDAAQAGSYTEVFVPFAPRPSSGRS